MDKNNYIDIHPTQAQVAKISYHQIKKIESEVVSFSVHCLMT
jgi:hypothetical protein